MPGSPERPAKFRRGTRLGVDWGTTRIGVAACDADAVLAYPVETVSAHDQSAALARIVELAEQYQVIEVVMGWPLALSGRPEIAAQSITEVAAQLAALTRVPVRLVDERLTSAVVNRQLASMDTRKRRKIADQAAAAGILEGALSHERNTGTPPGHLIIEPSMEGDV